MTFLNVEFGRAREGGYIPGEGPTDAKIVLVGEAGGAEEDRHKRPFVGPAGRVLEQCMHAAGLIRGETYLTNVVKCRPRNNDITPYYNPRTGRFTELAEPWLNELYEELAGLKANIIVALGNVPMAALTRRKKSVTKYRGYIERAEKEICSEKVLITLHPSSTFFRGEKHGGSGGGPGKGASPYIGRYYITMDLKKALAFSDSPVLIRPQRRLVTQFSDVQEVVEWIKILAKTGRVSCDIEVSNFEVSCMGLSASQDLGVSIPLSDMKRWSEYEELLIWRALDQYVFGDPGVVKVVQNGIFDLYFIFLKYGIVTKGPIEDIMIGHHIMYFEMAKALDFIASIYCGAQEYWKDMVKFDNIKENS